MGRRKVEMKRIESKNSRQVTFCKRRNGLVEKARQLSVLCECSVALVIVSATGKLHSFSSGDSMDKIIKRYETEHADDVETSDVAEEARNHISHEDLLEIVKSKLEEANSDDASVDSLIYLQEQLKTALSLTRTRKTELMMELVNTLQEENQVLTSKLTKMEKKLVETEEERAMSSENRSTRLLPVTLPLLK